MDSPLIPLPFLLHHPDDLITLLPQEVWDDEVVGYSKFFSPTTILYHIHSWGLEVVPMGAGTGDSLFHVFVFSRRPNKKFPGVGKNHKQKENQ
jgi:hypothetical protein